jgi:hypothetical protein
MHLLGEASTVKVERRHEQYLYGAQRAYNRGAIHACSCILAMSSIP